MPTTTVELGLDALGLLDRDQGALAPPTRRERGRALVFVVPGAQAALLATLTIADLGADLFLLSRGSCAASSHSSRARTAFHR
jgi:hypothetical protein